MVKEGKKTTPIHTQANPNQFEICLFTALGFYVLGLNSTWYINCEYLLINVGVSVEQEDVEREDMPGSTRGTCAFLTRGTLEKFARVFFSD